MAGECNASRVVGRKAHVTFVFSPTIRYDSTWSNTFAAGGAGADGIVIVEYVV